MGGRVAVVGAGWAGLAAAVVLAARGVPVTVFEASRSLGGRARRVAMDGVDLDNGQHILIGAYTETLGLMRRVGADPGALLARLPLELRHVSGFRLKAARLPAPLHLLVGLARATGFTASERFRAAWFVAGLRRTGFAVVRDESVTALLARHRQDGALYDRLWAPLCVAALNTPPAHASARVFATVLRDTLGGNRAASDLLLPRADLGALFPEPAARFLAAHGGEVRLGAPVRAIVREEAAFRLDADPSAFSHVVVAVRPTTPPRCWTRCQASPPSRWRSSPLSTSRSTPATSSIRSAFRSLFQCSDSPGACCSGRSIAARSPATAGSIAVVLSASGAHEALGHPALAAEIHRALEAELPELPAPLWRRVIAEKRRRSVAAPGSSGRATRRRCPACGSPGTTLPATIRQPSSPLPGVAWRPAGLVSVELG